MGVGEQQNTPQIFVNPTLARPVGSSSTSAVNDAMYTTEFARRRLDRSSTHYVLRPSIDLAASTRPAATWDDLQGHCARPPGLAWLGRVNDVVIRLRHDRRKFVLKPHWCRAAKRISFETFDPVNFVKSSLKKFRRLCLKVSLKYRSPVTSRKTMHEN